MITACAGLSKNSGPAVTGVAGSAEGQWRGRALVRDGRSGKSQELVLEMVAREPSRLRMEVTSSGLGVYLASFVLNGPEVRVLLARERRFIKTTADEDSLRALVPVRLSPESLMSLLFDRPLKPNDWRCQSGADGHVSRCVQIGARDAEALSVSFKESGPDKRRFEIVSGKSGIDLVLETSSPKVEIKPALFELEPPSGYAVETR